MWGWYIGAFVLSYCLGALPFGLLFGYAFGKGDIRKQGSGNIGTTNVLRVVGKQAALLTLICDMGKAAFASFLFLYLFGRLDIAVICGVCAVLGHNFSIFLRFSGGKGVASTLAVFFVWNLFLGGFAVAVWLIMALVVGYSSLSAITMFVLTPLFALFFVKNTVISVACLFLSVMGLIKHRSNIVRLCKGEEKKMFRKKK